MRKKGEMQFGETVFVVFIILIIIVLGFVFYSKIQEDNFKEELRKKSSQNLVLVAHSISSLPELECSIYKSSDFVCVDKFKAKNIKAILEQARSEKNTYYFDFLNNLRISIHQVYPNKQTYPIYDHYEGQSGGKPFLPVNVLINIYDPIEKTYSFGYMEIGLYE
jgi:sensor histidine kinase regulating citrate/malate metabolism